MTAKRVTNAVRAKAATKALQRRSGGIKLTQGQARTIVRSVRAANGNGTSKNS